MLTLSLWLPLLALLCYCTQEITVTQAFVHLFSTGFVFPANNNFNCNKYIKQWSVFSAVSVTYILHEQVHTTLEEILEKLPDEFNMVELLGKAEERTPYQMVALQECDRMNILTQEIRQSLQELSLGLKVRREGTHKLFNESNWHLLSMSVDMWYLWRLIGTFMSSLYLWLWATHRHILDR